MPALLAQIPTVPALHQLRNQQAQDREHVRQRQQLEVQTTATVPTRATTSSSSSQDTTTTTRKQSSASQAPPSVGDAVWYAHPQLVWAEGTVLATTPVNMMMTAAAATALPEEEHNGGTEENGGLFIIDIEPVDGEEVRQQLFHPLLFFASLKHVCTASRVVVAVPFHPSSFIAPHSCWLHTFRKAAKSCRCLGKSRPAPTDHLSFFL